MPRPHLSKPIDALERLFAQHHDDRAMLAELRNFFMSSTIEARTAPRACVSGLRAVSHSSLPGADTNIVFQESTARIGRSPAACCRSPESG